MTEILNTVITKEQINRLRVLLDTTDFNGVIYDKEKSLLEYGFVYDSQTGVVISTHPSYVWNKVNEPIKFGVSLLPKTQINETYQLKSDEIDLTESEFLDLCDELKINEIESKTSGLGLRSVTMDKTFDDLVEYLEKIVEKSLG